MTLALPTIVAPGLQDPRRGDAPGGFSWWYTDLVDDAGNGLVVIMSLGLPFLPGYASDARRGQAPPARRRPSVFVSALESGRLAFWALHEVDPAEVVWEADRAQLGTSGLTVSVEHGAVRLIGELAGVLPGCDWRLSVDLRGPQRLSSGEEPVTAAHEWTVLTAVARSEAVLTVGGECRRFRGRGYVDRNAGDTSLEQLDCASWTWGRLAFPDRERIWYLATDATGRQHSRSLTIHADGRTEVFRGGVTVVGARNSSWQLPYPARVRVAPDLSVSMPRPFDDSPFYGRYLVGAEAADGAVGHGFAEVCVPGRVDRAWMRPLVRMTVAREGRASSPWLPLFGGPQRGRVRRLMRSLVGTT